MGKILDLKRMKEKADQRALGEKLQELNQMKGRLQESENIRSSFNVQYKALKRNGIIDAMEYRRHINYQNILTGQILKIEHEIDGHMEKVNEARDELKKSHCQTQVFEKIRESHFTKYRKEIDKEMSKDMNEIAIERYRRGQDESGSALNVLLAIGAMAFLLTAIFIGILFLAGFLDMHKLQLLRSILQYRDDDSIQMIVDEKRPYVMRSATYKNLMEIQENYGRLLEEYVDDERVITKTVLDKRKEILRRVNDNFQRSKNSFSDDFKKLEDQEKDLVEREQKLKDALAAFNKQVKDKKAQSFSNAQDEVLKAMKSMDAEDVAAMLTGGANYDDYMADSDKQKEIPGIAKYTASYLMKMNPRQRAGVLQALGPKWSKTVNNYLEENFPLD